MKVLFDHQLPFSLAHGGAQIQIEQTKSALSKLEVETDWCRWWDDSQRADVIHFFGRPSPDYVRLTQKKGIRIVMSELLTGTASRPPYALTLQKWIIKATKMAMPRDFISKMAWESYQMADACVALTSWERSLMESLFSADPARVHVVPNGVEIEFFAVGNPGEADVLERRWLITTATITERKRVLELAMAAVHASVPLWVVGKPYSETDPYFLKFLEVVSNSRGLVKFEGPVYERAAIAKIYRDARGFVLLSTMESLSLSALEAAASKCPLLLTDLPWARCSFGSDASYCPVAGVGETAKYLRRFYDSAKELPLPKTPLTWPDVAAELKKLYQGLLN